MAEGTSGRLAVGVRAAVLAAVVAVAGCDDDRDRDAPATAPDRDRRELFRVPTEQMEPTLRFRQVVQLDPDPPRIDVGDIVVFRPPSNAEVNRCAVEEVPGRACPRSASTPLPFSFIKRVVAVGGDRISIRQGRVFVDGEVEARRYGPGGPRCELCDLPKAITVPRGQLYVLGDRRADRSDSRKWGPIRREWVIGRVVGVR
jgi:signal peptidase I